MDKEFYINQNRKTAYLLYGDKLDENRKVIGTNIWFDECWRMHTKQNEIYTHNSVDKKIMMI